MKDRVLKVVSQVMGVPTEQLNEKSSPDTVQDWDSLSHMNLVLALEEEFNVTFSDAEIVELLDIETIIKTLRGRVLGV